MESLPSKEESVAEFKIPAIDCRKFMRMIAPQDMWPLLYAQKNWGGHLHRAILGCALSEAADDELVDIVPGYVDALIADPKGRLYGDAEEQRYGAERLVSANVRHIDHDESSDPLIAFEKSLRYGNVTEIPRELWEELVASREVTE